MNRIVMGTTALLLFVVLAGGFVLGRQFTTARHGTYATASVSAVVQVSEAAEMRNAGDPVPMAAGTPVETLRDSGWLSKVPAVPAGAEPVRLVGDDGSRDGGPARVAVMRLADDAEDVCLRIVAQNRGSRIETATTSIPAGRTGCFRTDAALGSLDANARYAYSRV